MLEIYRPHVVGSAVSFEWELPTLTEFQNRITEVLKEFPWIVMEDASGGILGYAYAAKYRTRLAYQWCVETSVYVREGQHRAGVGKALYQELLPILKRQGFTRAYAVIALPNEKSVKFHEALGFTYLCTYPKVGFKLGKWHDVGWWEKALNDFGIHPKTPISFTRL